MGRIFTLKNVSHLCLYSSVKKKIVMNDVLFEALIMFQLLEAFSFLGLRY